jgi:Ca-activated chloride channel family protein
VPKRVKQSGRDVLFLVDVSRSMLARDLKPNRLERAKLAVSDALEAARRSSGDRVGIIVFAGGTQVVPAHQ